jgi:modification methylase
VANNLSGSIHKVGAKVQGVEACNGWTFWHMMTGQTLVPIDMMRQKLRQEMLSN